MKNQENEFQESAWPQWLGNTGIRGWRDLGLGGRSEKPKRSQNSIVGTCDKEPGSPIRSSMLSRRHSQPFVLCFFGT